MGLALRRTELLIEAAQLSHYVQSLRGPAGYLKGGAPQQGWTPYLTAHLKLTLAVPRGGTFFLLSRSIPRSRSFTSYRPLGVVELIPLPSYMIVEGRVQELRRIFPPTQRVHPSSSLGSALLTSAAIQPGPKTQLDPVAQGLRRGRG